MAAVDLGPGTLDLENLVADSPHTLRIEATTGGSPYVPTAVVMKVWTQTGQLLDTVTATIVDDAVELALASVTSAADPTRSSVLRHQIKADGVPWLKGSVLVRPESDGKGGPGSSRTTASVTIANGESTVTVSIVGDGTTATNTHIADPSGAHAATAISSTAVGVVTGTTVQAALGNLAGGASVADGRLIEIVSGEPAFKSWSSITRDSNGLISAGTFIWPDGSAGVWTTTSTHATGAIGGFTATHAASAKTVTVAITRDAEGNATATTTTVS